MNQLLRCGVLLIAILLLLPSVFAAAKVDTANKVVINSGEWQDVYSAMMYANLQGIEPSFLTSSAHGPILPYSIPKASSLHILSSRGNPYVVGYSTVMNNFGFESVTEDTYSNMNLELAEELTSVNKYIIVDDAYGYNAISVAAYAVVDDYYVIFANDRLARSVSRFLESKNPEDVIIFGQVDARVKTLLAQFNPEIINYGDRFQNNIELVKRYKEIRHRRQVVLSNGEFIESGIMSGEDPVLFVGRGNVPEQIKDYIRNSDIDVAILIGNELVGSATTIRREVGVSVFVKFAQGSRSPTGPISTVEDLDRFPMPSYSLDLSLFSVFYNRATNMLEVTYQNNVNVGTYLKGTIQITTGGQTLIVGDPEVQFIDKNQIKTFLYNETVDGEPLFIEEDANGTLTTIFGESTGSLEFLLRANFPVDIIEVLDESTLLIENVVYDRLRKEFVVTIENTGPVDAYVFTELSEVVVNEEIVTLATLDRPKVASGKKAKLYAPVVLTDSDIEENTLIRAKAFYGERQNSLIKTTYAEFEFLFASIDFVYYILLVLVLILILLIIFTRKKCPECKKKNHIMKKRCKKCGALLKKRKHRSHHKHKH